MRFERRTADKTAVDFRHCHKFVDVFGVHAAAVLNAYFVVGAVSAIKVRHCVADNLDGCVRVVGGCGFAGADCPYGFVCDDDVFKFGFVNIFESLGGLTDNDFFGFARFALFQKFADADNGFQPLGKCRLNACVDGLIGLAEILTAFAVV